MEKLDILLWCLGGGFIILLGILRIIWNEIKDLNVRIDKQSDLILDIDRRLCRIEGSLSAKDCCMLKDDQKKQKAE